MGGAPRNPAPRNRFSAWIVKPSGSHCTDASRGTEYRSVPLSLRSTSRLSDSRSAPPDLPRDSPEPLPLPRSRSPAPPLPQNTIRGYCLGIPRFEESLNN